MLTSKLLFTNSNEGLFNKILGLNILDEKQVITCFKLP